MKNIFDINPDTIVRRMDPLGTYKEYAISFLVKKYGISVAKAEDILKIAVEEKGYRDPDVTYYEKDRDTLDKSREVMKLSKYLSSINDEKITIAPSFTCYNKTKVTGEKWLSTHAKLMDTNKGLRNHHKKLAKIAYSKKDFVEGDIQNTINTTKKMVNNSYSGAACQLHLPFAAHSSHYTFTSVTRIVTSTANVISESILAGYRLYLTPNDVYNQFMAILIHHDLNGVKKAVEHYNLHIPTVNEIMGMVEYNTYYFWENEVEMTRIRDFVMTLNDIERCAILYHLDLKHLVMYNKDIIEPLIFEASVPKTGISSDLKTLDDADDYKLNTLYHILSDSMVDKGLNHHKHAGTPLADLLASTLHNFEASLLKLQILVDGFFKTEVLPINVAHYKKVPRRAIALSDTDSTVGIYQTLVESKFGHSNLTSQTIAYSSVLSVFVSEVIVNTLYGLSVNMNVLEEKRSTLSMKSEFFFPFMAPSTASKHYLTLGMIEEMLILLDEPIVFHGVSLISAKISDDYNNYKNKISNALSDSVTKGIKINPLSLIREVIQLENDIEDRILSADKDILSLTDIKDPSSYNTAPQKSPYFHHMLWEAVFENKYGKAPVPPYIAVKIPLSTNTAKRFSEFVNKIDDNNIREGFIELFKKHKKNHIGTIQIPLELINDHGIPDEIIPVIDVNRLILSQTASIRLVLSLCGVGSKDDVLLRDTYL